MLIVVSWVLVIGLLISLGLLIYIDNTGFSKDHFYLEKTVLFVSFIVLGALLISNATTEESAIVAWKICYLGSCFAEWCLLMFIFRFLNYPYRKSVMNALLVVHMFLYSLVITFPTCRFFATEVRWKTDVEVPRMLVTYNWGGYLHMVLMTFYVIIIVLMTGEYAYHHRGEQKGKTAVCLGVCAVLPGIGLIGMFTGLAFPGNLTPELYVMSIALMSFITLKGRLFDTVGSAKDRIIEEMQDAVVVLDNNLNILYYNKAMKKILPDIETNRRTIEMVQEMCRMVKREYVKNGNYYQLSVSTIMSAKKQSGFMIIFNDVTELMNYADSLETKVNSKIEEIEKIQQKVIISFANLIEMRDDITGQHVKRTSAYVRLLVTELVRREIYTEQLTPIYANFICLAAPLHDIGKISISDTILQKPGRLTTEEFEIIKTHSVIGGKILDQILTEVETDEYLLVARDMATFHHERWDGGGYPKGLAGEAIPLCARIMALADVFDALVSKRQYKEAFSMDKAFQIMKEESGTHFDPTLAEAFLNIRDEIEEVVQNEYVQ